jgi:hydroxymethylbilane synthase
LRPDLTVVDIRGNVDSRLNKLDSRPEWTGTILAVAGLVRLGLAQRIGERLPPDVMLPAPGQGALAVTVRTNDVKIGSTVRRAVHHEASGILVAAERAFLRRLEGGCQVPVAAYAEPGDAPLSVRLHGRVVSVNGDKVVNGQETALAPDESAADQLGTTLAERLLSLGATAILTEVRSAVIPAVTEP